MSIGRITGGIIQPTIDATLALASLNFDFSLVKLEAPPEFHGLGRALSRQRREAAEAGSAHITARKLGALFAKEIPDTPKLIEAYGKRVSEIAGSNAINPQGLNGYGVFADYVGADGTSIWAAATSGRDAISVHLLACMLARIWSASEATSIWAELVTERKRRIVPVNPTDQLSYPDLLASQIQISRDQLAQWDNSARAWLQRADEAKKMEQTQTMLILDNLNVCVNAKPTTYASVTEAWRSALLGMESLLTGVPQNISNGGLLLALFSWHLYPDMIALGGTLVSQNDNLFTSTALLTLGLEGSPAQKDKGIYWSLSLAHMKYYGDPINANGSIGDTATRLTLTEFNHVVLGSVISSWGFDSRSVMNAARMIVAIHNVVKHCEHPSWLDILADTAKILMSSKDHELKIFLKLIALGRKKPARLLCDVDGHPPPVFGLSEFRVFVRLLIRDQDKIDLLRKYTPKFFPNAEPKEVIVRYRFSTHAGLMGHRPKTDKSSLIKTENKNRRSDNIRSQNNSTSRSTPAINISVDYEDIFGNDETVAEYATAKPFCTECSTCDASSTGHQSIHHRWICEEVGIGERPQSVVSTMEAESRQSQEIKNIQGQKSHWRIPVEAFNLRIDTSKRSSNVTSTNLDEQFPSACPDTYELFLGDPDSTALFVASHHHEKYEQERRAPNWSRADNFHRKMLHFGDIMSALEGSQIDPHELSRHIASGSNYEGYFTSLAAVEFINDLYKTMGSATINVKIASQTLKDLKWVQNLNLSRKRHRARERSFACIASLDTGTVDLHPSKFENVMTISSTDSMYIAAPLMCDPEKTASFGEIRHIIGNVGRHGLLLLVPPPVPQTIKPELEMWREIEHASFNGKIEDTFAETSLHLSFTDWSTPIDLGRGQHDAEAYVVESLVSVHDRSRWIADLDILESLKKGSKQYDHEFFFSAGCHHDPSSDVLPGADADNFGQLVCIKTWDEFLDRPECPSVVMAHNNWLARLAMTTLGVRRGDRVFVGNGVCMHCLEELRKFDPNLAGKVLFFA